MLFTCYTGAFACGLREPSAVLPGLAVAGFGDVELPLDPQRAKALLQICQPAPFGKGADTVIDTTVRRTSQLDPAQISRNNPGVVAFSA